MKKACCLSLLLLCLLSSSSAQDSNKVAIEERYDRFSDRTAEIIPVPGLKLCENLWFQAFFSFSGRTLKARPDYVFILIHAQSKRWEYIKSRDLVFLIDGEQMDIGQMDHDGSIGDGYVMEHLSAKIIADQFQKIASGKVVEGKLFTTEFKFTEDQLALLRELAKRMEPE